MLEWNGRSLVNKTYDDVHDVVSDSRHDSQVELKVSRLISSSVLRSSSDLRFRGPSTTTGTPRASNRTTDPSSFMLNPAAAPSQMAPVGTRIQVGSILRRIVLIAHTRCNHF